MKIQDYTAFWQENQRAFRFDGSSDRIPVDLFLNGDWICDYMQADCPRYYTDYSYQKQIRDACSEITFKELGHRIKPAIDFGVVQDVSIYGGQFQCLPHATPVMTHVVEKPEDIPDLVRRMKHVSITDAGLIPAFLRWRDQIDKDYGVTLTYGDAIKGGATTMAQMCGVTNFCTWVVTNPDEMHMLADCWLETTIRYVDTMRSETGYHSGPVQKFSLMSDVTGLLSPSIYETFLQEAERELYRRYAGGPNDKRYYHADYHLMHILPSLRDIGINEVNIDPYVDCSQILSIIPDALIWGQIPPTKTLLYGSPDEIRQCVRRDIRQAGHSRQLIIGPAGSINPGTSFENLRAMCEAAEEFSHIYHSHTSGVSSCTNV